LNIYINDMVAETSPTDRLQGWQQRIPGGVLWFRRPVSGPSWESSWSSLFSTAAPAT